MEFKKENVRTALDAESCKIFEWGYFANDLASLKGTIETLKPNMRTVYDRLDGVCEERFERRFCCSCGTFSLFYPLDKVENKERY